MKGIQVLLVVTLAGLISGNVLGPVHVEDVPAEAAAVVLPKAEDAVLAKADAPKEAAAKVSAAADASAPAGDTAALTDDDVAYLLDEERDIDLMLNQAEDAIEDSIATLKDAAKEESPVKAPVAAADAIEKVPAGANVVSKDQPKEATNDNTNNGRLFSDEDLKNVKIEIKDVPADFQDTVHSDDIDDHETDSDEQDMESEEDNVDDGPEIRAEVTDTEHGEILREDEEEPYTKDSRFWKESDDDQFIDEDENAISFDEALRHETISEDDDGSPAFLKIIEEEDQLDEDIKDYETAMAKRNAFWGGRRRRRFFRAIARVATRTVRSIGTAVRRVVTNVGNGLKTAWQKSTKFVKGVIKEIPFKEIGAAIGKAAQHMLEFAKCAVPGMELLEKCVQQAIKSVGSSCSGNNCHIKLGGKNTGCLSMGGTDTYEKAFGPVTVTGVVNKQAGFALQYFFQTGKIVLGFYGTISIQPTVSISLSRSYTKEYTKRIELAPAKTVFRKMIIITIGPVPVPVLVEVRVQPVARIKVKGKTHGSGSISFTLKDAAHVSLDNMQISYDPNTGPRGTIRASHNLANLQITKSISLIGTTELHGTVSVGPEVVVSINGVPMKVFPSVQFKAEGTLTAQHENGASCIGGSLKFSTNLMALIIPDVKRLTSVSGNFGTACRTMAHLQCKINPIGRAANCFAKSFLGVDPCKELEKGCDEMTNQMKRIPDIVQMNPILSTIYFLRRGLVAITFGNLRKCGAADSPAASAAVAKPVATTSGSCRTANWWHSFDRAGLSKCASSLQYLRGLYRNSRGWGAADGLYRLKEARCCYRNSALGVKRTCAGGNWGLSFDKNKSWSKCPNGYFAQGLKRSGGHRLHNLKGAQCCRPTKAAKKWGHCYKQNIVKSFDNKGWSECKANYFLAGLYRGTCNNLYCIEYMYCCRMNKA